MDVLINAGARDTAFSGGKTWDDPQLQELIRQFVWAGGGFIGVGAPTARTGSSAPIMVLDDVLGVDMEIDWTLSHTRHPVPHGSPHFITQGMSGAPDTGESPGDIVATGANLNVLVGEADRVKLAVNPFGEGRSVYIAGLPYSPENSRMLHRAIMWASHRENEIADVLITDNPAVEVAWYPRSGKILVYNGSPLPQHAVVTGAPLQRQDPEDGDDVASVTVDLPGYASEWIVLQGVVGSRPRPPILCLRNAVRSCRWCGDEGGCFLASLGEVLQVATQPFFGEFLSTALGNHCPH